MSPFLHLCISVSPSLHRLIHPPLYLCISVSPPLDSSTSVSLYLRLSTRWTHPPLDLLPSYVVSIHHCTSFHPMLCLLLSTNVSPFILLCVFFYPPLYILSSYSVSSFIHHCISFYPMLCLLPSTTVSPFILLCFFFHPPLYPLSFYVVSSSINHCISFHPMLCLLSSTSVSPSTHLCTSFHPPLYLLPSTTVYFFSFPAHLSVSTYLCLRISYHAPQLSSSLFPFLYLSSLYLLPFNSFPPPLFLLPCISSLQYHLPSLYLITSTCVFVSHSFPFRVSFPAPLFLLPSTFISPSFQSGSGFHSVLV